MSQWGRFRTRLAGRELSFATVFLTVTVVLALVGLRLFLHHTPEARVVTIGESWLHVPVPLPPAQRMRYLRLALFFWALALLSLVSAISMLVQYRDGAAERMAARQQAATDREAARQEYARQEARRQWLATPAGYAHSLLESGYLEMSLVLRVQPPLHLDTVRQVQQVGWTLDQRHDHPPVTIEASSANGLGGHQVVRSTVQDATFRFVRTMSAQQGGDPNAEAN